MMGLDDALDILRKTYECETNEDMEFCNQYPLLAGVCDGCPYNATVKETTEAMRAILVAHGRMKGGGEA